jgi:hypothetical protein
MDRPRDQRTLYYSIRIPLNYSLNLQQNEYLATFLGGGSKTESIKLVFLVKYNIIIFICVSDC